MRQRGSNPGAKAQVTRSLLLEHRRRQADRLELAQAMARQGFHTFTLHPGTKRPIRPGYVHSTTDPDQLAEWFEETPDCNYGAHPGRDYVVIDLDRKPGKNGIAAFEKICRENGVDNFQVELDTFIVQTANQAPKLLGTRVAGNTDFGGTFASFCHPATQKWPNLAIIPPETQDCGGGSRVL